MALPCLLNYYLAAQIRSLVCWCNPNCEAKWKDIELSLMGVPLQSTLGCLDMLPEVYQLQNMCISFSLRKWEEDIRGFEPCNNIGVLNWPAYHPGFLPALQDHKFRLWAKRGITSFCRIIQNRELISFSDLCPTYEVGKEDFYRYLQVRSFFMQEIRNPDLAIDSGIIQIFIDAYSSQSTKGTIGKLYKSLMARNKNSTEYIRQRWEKETNLIIPEEIW